jgi:hypothetical protein
MLDETSYLSRAPILLYKMERKAKKEKKGRDKEQSKEKMSE